MYVLKIITLDILNLHSIIHQWYLKEDEKEGIEWLATSPEKTERACEDKAVNKRDTVSIVSKLTD